ncbi:MAG: hypothetical protein D6785_01420 [Planctomycetota bacterium]|nr:MAG: hypothetical protein D6785_01420 [Planctomycetota bacterium]
MDDLWIHVIAVLGLGLLCCLWGLWQLHFGDHRSGRCRGCQGGSCQKSCSFEKEEATKSLKEK